MNKRPKLINYFIASTFLLAVMIICSACDQSTQSAESSSRPLLESNSFEEPLDSESPTTSPSETAKALLGTWIEPVGDQSYPFPLSSVKIVLIFSETEDEKLKLKVSARCEINVSPKDKFIEDQGTESEIAIENNILVLQKEKLTTGIVKKEITFINRKYTVSCGGVEISGPRLEFDLFGDALSVNGKRFERLVR